MFMVIYVDGYYRGVALETGAFISRDELSTIYLNFIKDNKREAFPELLCEKFGFRFIESKGDRQYDLVIDTDTDRIYKPTY
jgi:hypothetical protein